MKLRTTILLILCIAVVMPLLTLLILPKPLEVQQTKYDFEVVDGVSINLDTDALHFGGSFPGATLERGMNISSNEAGRIVVRVEGPGDLIVSENNFYLEANETRLVLFSLTIPLDTSFGLYEGVIYVQRYKR